MICVVRSVRKSNANGVFRGALCGEGCACGRGIRIGLEHVRNPIIDPGKRVK